MKYVYTSGKKLLEICNREKIKISKAAILRECEMTGCTEDMIYHNFRKVIKIMRNGTREALEKGNDCKGWIIGGEAEALDAQQKAGKNICGTVVSNAIKYAMGVLQVNCSMGKIVATPTAGSSGVLPGALFALQEEHGFSDKQIMDAVLNASAIGVIITRNANVAGAEGGCQAEVGSASAMTASAIVELFGGTPEQSLIAASYALQNLLGLVCDPIGGLVEAPCQGRNAIGTTGALIAAEIALAGVSIAVPFDETVEAMRQVGNYLPPELRETAKGGIAITPSACKLCKKFKN